MNKKWLRFIQQMSFPILKCFFATAAFHNQTVVLQCLIKGLESQINGNEASDDKARCPYNDCDVVISDPKSVVEHCKTELELLYPPIQSPIDIGQLQELNLSSSVNKIVNVVMLTGDSVSIAYSSDMTVNQLKNSIQKTKFSVEPDKQQLTYNEKVLTVSIIIRDFCETTVPTLCVLCQTQIKLNSAPPPSYHPPPIVSGQCITS